MNRIISVAILAVGILLVVLGINATNSFSSDWSNFWTGSPTNKAIWMLIIGIVLMVIGIGGAGMGLMRPRR